MKDILELDKIANLQLRFHAMNDLRCVMQMQNVSIVTRKMNMCVFVNMVHLVMATEIA